VYVIALMKSVGMPLVLIRHHTHRVPATKGGRLKVPKRPLSVQIECTQYGTLGTAHAVRQRHTKIFGKETAWAEEAFFIGKRATLR